MTKSFCLTLQSPPHPAHSQPPKKTSGGAGEPKRLSKKLVGQLLSTSPTLAGAGGPKRLLNEFAAALVGLVGFKDGCSSPSWKVDAILSSNHEILQQQKIATWTNTFYNSDKYI